MKALAALLLALTACSSAPKVDPASALSAAQDVCRLYDLLPADKRTPESDQACFVVKRICIDPLLEAPAPAVGNKVVDAGSGGSPQ